MQRRTVVKYLTIAAPVAAIGGSYLFLSAERDRPQLSISATIEKLKQLSSRPIVQTGTWSPYQVFNHCAQSIEFSMTGFPKSKSELFQKTAGTVAFSVFSAKGKMSHDLAEPIPGAPSILPAGSVQIALERLVVALKTFDAYQGTLKPHFAFGELNKSAYSLAHVLHINNRLEEFSAG